MKKLQNAFGTENRSSPDTISLTHQLPWPLEKKPPPLAQWYDICPITDERFQDLLKSAKATLPEELTHKMIVTFKHIKVEQK